jgi:hypothetical protein
MRRPSFQFYPQDFTGNAKLRRCSWTARGVWIWTLALMHDSDEYGVLRWPLDEIAQALGCQLVTLKELVAKGVLKGSDGKHDAYVYTPIHARKKGVPVTLLEAGNGPCWYSSRMLDDEHIRQTKGDETRFRSSPDGPKGEAEGAPKGEPKGERISTPSGAPHAATGEPQGDGSASASASALNGVQTPHITREPPAPRKPSGDRSPMNGKNAKPPNGWHRSSAGIMAAGVLMHMPPRKGETETEYKGRLFNALGQAPA